MHLSNAYKFVRHQSLLHLEVLKQSEINQRNTQLQTDEHAKLSPTAFRLYALIASHLKSVHFSDQTICAF